MHLLDKGSNLFNPARKLKVNRNPQKYLSYEDTLLCHAYPLRQVRYCPTDNEVKSDWQEELKTETDFLKIAKFREANTRL